MVGETGFRVLHVDFRVAVVDLRVIFGVATWCSSRHVHNIDTWHGFLQKPK